MTAADRAELRALREDVSRMLAILQTLRPAKIRPRARAKANGDDPILALLVASEEDRAFTAAGAFKRNEAKLRALGVKSVKSLGCLLDSRVGRTVGEFQLRAIDRERAGVLWCFQRVLRLYRVADTPV